MQKILVFVLDFFILGGAICLYFFFDEKKQMEGLLFTALFFLLTQRILCKGKYSISGMKC